jgi:hypothetical protein
MSVEENKKCIQNQSLVEYITQVGLICNVAFDWDEEGNPYVFTNAPVNFMKRYNYNKMNIPFTYEEYIKNKDIQGTLEALGVDIEKFWYLLLFAYDFSDTTCFKSCNFPETPIKNIKKLSDFILERQVSDNPERKALFEEEITVTVSVKGKKVAINDPNTIYYIARFCTEGLDKYSDKIKPTFTAEKLLNNKVTTSYSVLLWHFSYILDTFFKVNPQFKGSNKRNSSTSLNKKLLISRLLYFTKLTKNEDYLSDEDIVKALLKQYKGHKIADFNPEY